MRKSNRRGPRFTATIAAGALALAGTTLALAGAANAAQAGPAAQTSYQVRHAGQQRTTRRSTSCSASTTAA